MSVDPLFRRSVDALTAILESLQRKLHSLPSLTAHPSNNKDVITALTAQRDLLRECERDLYDANNQLASMEQSARHGDYHQKSNGERIATESQEKMERWRAIVRNCSAVVAGGQLVTQAIVQQYTSDGYSINIGSSPTPLSSSSSSSSSGTRQTLLSVKSQVDESSDSLLRTEQKLAEATAVGADAHSQLLQQREQFIKQKQTLDETDESLSRARRTLIRIRRRVATNKFIQGGIILLELGICGLVVYLKYYR